MSRVGIWNGVMEGGAYVDLPDRANARSNFNREAQAAHVATMFKSNTSPYPY